MPAIIKNWMEEALEELRKNGIRYIVADNRYGIINCFRRSDRAMFVYYVGGGKIVGWPERGLTSLIKLLTDSGIGERAYAKSWKNDRVVDDGRAVFNEHGIRMFRIGGR